MTASKFWYFRATYRDGTSVYQDKLTMGQAKWRYDKFVRDMAVLDLEEVTYGVM